MQTKIWCKHLRFAVPLIVNVSYSRSSFYRHAALWLREPRETRTFLVVERCRKPVGVGATDFSQQFKHLPFVVGVLFLSFFLNVFKFQQSNSSSAFSCTTVRCVQWSCSQFQLPFTDRMPMICAHHFTHDCSCSVPASCDRRLWPTDSDPIPDRIS